MSQTEPTVTDQPPAGTSDAMVSTGGPTGAGLSPDERFHLLQTRRRRDALRYLHDAEGPVRMRDLAEQVAAWENDTTVRALTSTQRQRVYIPLYQTHLPKLDEAGVIEYDQCRGVVERRPLADELYPYIDGVGTIGGGSAGRGGGREDAGPVPSRDAHPPRDVAGVDAPSRDVGPRPRGRPASTLVGIAIGAVVAVVLGLLAPVRAADAGE